MIIHRTLSEKLLRLSKKLPAITIAGPRQSGKTTLVTRVFPRKPYVSLEDLDTRDFALSDPRGFLAAYPDGAIIDEIQRVPPLFSYLQGILDKKNKPGMFILTGSQQLLLMENVSQTLAGRIGILNLLPFSLQELLSSPFKKLHLGDLLHRGMYPRIYDKKLEPHDWYPSYVQTYLERDVRLLKNVTDLHAFSTFLKLCAARTGQLLNLTSLATDCGITHNTARSWIGVLEASFIAFLLHPHHRNFNKRLVKMPKLYFYDTGLACSLMGITDKTHLDTHPLKGNIFETFIVSELIKQRFNKGMPANIYFWRDKTGHEIDCVIEAGQDLVPIEIKSSQTITDDFPSNLNFWRKLTGQKQPDCYVVYAGGASQKRLWGNVIGWKDISRLSSV